jgi:hypothetical protein
MANGPTTVVLALLGTALTPSAGAQPLVLPPPTYSFVVASRFFNPDVVTMQVDRDHDREAVEFSISPNGFPVKPERKRILFDFADHRIYIQDAAGCRVIGNELENRAPWMMDPLNGGWVEQLGNSQPAILRQEQVNGVPTRLIEGGSYRYWLAKDYDFPIRQVEMYNGRQSAVELDVTRLRLTAPAASLFVTPTGCEVMDADPVGDDVWRWEKPLKLEGKPLRLPPPTYSLRWTSFDLGAPITMQVDRDRDHEKVEVVGQGNRKRVLFDFAAHQVFVQDDRGCRILRYLPGQAPGILDLVTSGAAGNLTAIRPKLLRWEPVNGMPARVFDAHDAGPAKIRYWLERDYDFPLKEIVYQLDDSDRPTSSNKVSEVLQLRYTAPAAALFDPPKGCAAVEGEIGEEFESWTDFLKSRK